MQEPGPPSAPLTAFSCGRGAFVSVGSAIPDNYEHTLKSRVQVARAAAAQTAEPQKKKSNSAGAAKTGPGPGRKTGPRGKRGVTLAKNSITVATLIERKLIKEGSVVKVQHRGESVEGVLEVDGSVVCGDDKYTTCAEFATAVKRKITKSEGRPDDGWRSCVVNNRTLNDYRDEILEA
eukprot:jgi/Ulvmu1/8419/UM042_0126.1